MFHNINEYSTEELINMVRKALDESGIEYTIGKGKIEFDSLLNNKPCLKKWR